MIIGWQDSLIWMIVRNDLSRSIGICRCGAFITWRGETRLFWRGDWYGWVGMERLYPHALHIDLAALHGVGQAAA